jgi:DNA-binding MurR/RpiR family transcriptional regulator
MGVRPKLTRRALRTIDAWYATHTLFDGRPLKVMAHRFGVHPNTVLRAARRQGPYSRVPIDSVRPAWALSRFTEEELEELVEWHKTARKSRTRDRWIHTPSLKIMAQRMGTSDMTIVRALRRLGIYDH